ncbi:MAG: polyphenol oxidase family protein [Candidatus Pacebacteria bacterium]|nr:polyphenol oxidase family protein [Candidatus Paceibacterota bacterium]MBP6924280.1 polyphenol oxidase family protein [Candidatus Paceibacterota bacterium]
MSSLYKYSLGSATITILGQQQRIIDDLQLSFDQAKQVGAHPDKITQLIVASDNTRAGHKLVCPARANDLMYCDGAVLSENGSAVIMQTADCAVLVIYDRVSGRIACAHAGRPGLSPSKHCASCTITENAIHALIGHDGDRSQLEALITGNICGPCFKHDKNDAFKLIEPFLRYPSTVFANVEEGALDLFLLIKHNLMFAGIPESQIRHEGPCTLETPLLSSHRRGDDTRNTFIIVKNE